MLLGKRPSSFPGPPASQRIPRPPAFAGGLLFSGACVILRASNNRNTPIKATCNRRYSRWNAELRRIKRIAPAPTNRAHERANAASALPIIGGTRNCQGVCSQWMPSARTIALSAISSASTVNSVPVQTAHPATGEDRHTPSVARPMLRHPCEIRGDFIQ